MRLPVLFLCLALTGCAWFTAEEDAPVIVPVKARDEVVKAIALPSLNELVVTPEMIAKSVDVARSTVEMADTSKDKAAERVVKATSVSDLSKVSSYAVGLGFLALLGSSFIPIPGLKLNALLTIGIGALLSILGPWLSDILGDENVRTIAYFALGIVALSAAIGLGWYILDKVKDETEHDEPTTKS